MGRPPPLASPVPPAATPSFVATARKLGIEPSSAVRACADEVIE
jgi:hypothetical protein